MNKVQFLEVYNEKDKYLFNVEDISSITTYETSRSEGCLVSMKTGNSYFLKGFLFDDFAKVLKPEHIEKEQILTK